METQTRVGGTTAGVVGRRLHSQHIEPRAAATEEPVLETKTVISEDKVNKKKT